MKTLNEIKNEKLEYIERQVKEEYTIINKANEEELKKLVETETKRRKTSYKEELFLYKLLFIIGIILITIGGISTIVEAILK